MDSETDTEADFFVGDLEITQSFNIRGQGPAETAINASDLGAGVTGTASLTASVSISGLKVSDGFSARREFVLLQSLDGLREPDPVAPSVVAGRNPASPNTGNRLKSEKQAASSWQRTCAGPRMGQGTALHAAVAELSWAAFEIYRR